MSPSQTKLFRTIDEWRTVRVIRSATEDHPAGFYLLEGKIHVSGLQGLIRGTSKPEYRPPSNAVTVSLSVVYQDSTASKACKLDLKTYDNENARALEALLGASPFEGQIGVHFLNRVTPQRIVNYVNHPQLEACIISGLIADYRPK